MTFYESFLTTYTLVSLGGFLIDLYGPKYRNNLINLDITLNIYKDVAPLVFENIIYTLPPCLIIDLLYINSHAHISVFRFLWEYITGMIGCIICKYLVDKYISVLRNIPKGNHKIRYNNFAFGTLYLNSKEYIVKFIIPYTIFPLLFSYNLSVIKYQCSFLGYQLCVSIFYYH